MSGNTPPSQQELTEVLAATTWVRIDGVFPGELEGAPIEVRAPAQLAEMRDCLAIVEDDRGFYCMCMGSVKLELHDAERLLAVITVHHGVSIRWDRWDADAELRNQGSIYEWLAAAGITEPLAEFKEDEQRQREALQERERWRQAMPPCLAPFWGSQRGDFRAPETTGSSVPVPPGLLSEGLLPAPPENENYLPALWQVLVAAYPEPEERVRVLLGWFGRGAGPWSGYPSYEVIPELFLREHPTQVLVSVLSREGLSPEEWEGAARYLAGWSFRQKKPEDLKLLPTRLRKHLLEHSLRSADEDKKERARNAFEDPAS